jgi:antirestriction protein ArdC
MKDAYQEITDRLLEMVDGAGNWAPPWRELGLDRPSNAITKKRYTGVNVFMCWAAAHRAGYSSNRWATFNQWQAADCKVRKGAKGTPIIFFKQYEREGESGDPTKSIVSRVSYVFNAEQVEGAKAMEPEPTQGASAIARRDDIDNAIKRLNATIDIGGDRACYVPSIDTIRMPKPEQFVTMENYYSVLFHELVHWTGAKKRLDRNLSTSFGSDAYAVEEMIAEMGAAFLSADFGITNYVRDDHARYLKSWLEAAKKDKRALVRAASQASKAADFILNFNEEEELREVA